MQKDPYLILGIDQNATQNQIKEAYENLRARYMEERFSEGEVGTNATRMLSDVEWAYNECMDEFNRNISFSAGSSYGGIEEMIRNNQIEDAQNALDAIENRDAEWHYLQAIVYHKRSWNFESKKQLELALALDNGNEKYLKALDNLNKVIGGTAPQGDNVAGNAGAAGAGAGGRAGYSRPDQTTRGAGNGEACCNTCSSLICCDMCCECCGGDLISCC